jgi:hypothetical protein
MSKQLEQLELPSKMSGESNPSGTPSLYGVNIHKTFSDHLQLKEYLTQLSQDLILRRQSKQIPVGLLETMEFLNDPKLMKMVDEDSKLLLSCCLVEALCICVPTSVKSHLKLRIFRLLIRQIDFSQSLIGNAEKKNRVNHIISTLATEKLCVMLVELLTRCGISEALQVVRSLFEAIIDSLEENGSDEGECSIFPNQCFNFQT